MTSNSLVLLLERPGDADRAPLLDEIPIVADGPSFLHASGSEGIQVLDHAQTGVLAAVESVGRSGRRQMVVVPARGSCLRRNSLPLSDFAVLEVGDRLDLPGGAVLHVSARRKPRLGPPREDQVGQICPVCRIPLTRSTRVYNCPSCDVALHLEDEQVPVDRRLECLLLSPVCPRCDEPVSLDAGLVHTPES